MAGMPITEERKKLIQFSASYAAVPAYFAVLESSDLAAFQSELERAQLDRIEAVEQAALDALERAFAGRIVGVQVATPHASLLEAYLGDVVEIRRYDTAAPELALVRAVGEALLGRYVRSPVSHRHARSR